MKSRRKWIDPEDFVLMRCRAGLTLASAASLLDVNVRTVRNWEQGVTAIPYSAYRLLKIVNGYVFTSTAWDGWFVRGGALYSPAQRSFKPHELVYLSNYLWMARQWLKDREASRGARIDAARHTDHDGEKIAVPHGRPILNAPALITAPLHTDFGVLSNDDADDERRRRRREAPPSLDYKILSNGEMLKPASMLTFSCSFKRDTNPLLSVSVTTASAYTDWYTLCEVNNGSVPPRSQVCNSHITGRNATHYGLAGIRHQFDFESHAG